jgi:hypothetical protein
MRSAFPFGRDWSHPPKSYAPENNPPVFFAKKYKKVAKQMLNKYKRNVALVFCLLAIELSFNRLAAVTTNSRGG